MGAEPAPPTQHLNESQVSTFASSTPFLGSPGRVPYRTQVLGNLSPAHNPSLHTSAADAPHRYQPGLASVSQTPSFKWSKQARQQPHDVPCDASNPSQTPQQPALKSSSSNSSRPMATRTPKGPRPGADASGGHSRCIIPAAGPQNVEENSCLGLGSPWASRQNDAGTLWRPATGMRGLPRDGSSSNGMETVPENRSWRGLHDSGYPGSAQPEAAAGAPLQLPPPPAPQERSRPGTFGLKPMVVSAQAASMQGRLGAGEDNKTPFGNTYLTHVSWRFSESQDLQVVQSSIWQKF